MLELKGLRTFAINANDLATAEKFYTQVLGGTVAKRFDPTEEQLKKGRVREVDVQLGNFQVHIFDASNGQRPGIPHHTIMTTWKEKEVLIRELEQGGSKVERTRDHPDGKGYSLYVQDPDGNLWEIWAAP
jgi:catechol 2,3-dioxygenase-like lactoylglutathione lyase family enzyme